MPNNFKTCHNTGIIKLVAFGKKRIRIVSRYYSIKHRTDIMRRWKRLMMHKEYYIILIPDWDLWNGKLN